MPAKLNTEEVVGALKSAGLSAAVLSRRHVRPGFKVTKFSPAVVAVEYHGWGDLGGTDHAAEASRLEAVLAAAGFVVRRPWPDPSILAVTGRPRTA